MKIEIWSDVVCPWCYIGKRRLEAAMEEVDFDVEIEWKSFELDPSAPNSTSKPLNELLANKYRMTLDRADEMMENVRQMAELEGLDFKWDTAKTGNTFDAHQLIHFASKAGRGAEMKERLLHAYFSEGFPISDRDELISLSESMGFDGDAVRAMYADNDERDAVRGDELEARQIGVTGVPFFLIERQFAIPGAQSAETIKLVLEQVHQKLNPVPEDGASCDIDGC